MTKYKENIFLIIILSVLFIGANTAFSQDSVPAEQSGEVVTQNSQWAMGEIINVDSAANKFDLKEYDFDSETEKTITVTVTGQTNYVNALALTDLKSGDVVSVDYRVGPQGDNIADNVSLEKEQDSEVALPSAQPQTAAAPDKESPGTSNVIPPDKGFVPSPENTEQNQ